MIELLNLDLGREYSHWNFYMQAATNVIGLHRAELSEFFLESAAGEMKHIEAFKRLIIGLGGKPTTVSAYFENDLTNAEELLKAALQMEDDVVAVYVGRIEDASELQNNGGSNKVDGKYIELFLEDQILDSRGDADNIREMVKCDKPHCRR